MQKNYLTLMPTKLLSKILHVKIFKVKVVILNLFIVLSQECLLLILKYVLLNNNRVNYTPLPSKMLELHSPPLLC